MFTGIVQATGRIVAADPAADGVRLRIDAERLEPTDIVVGDSIAVAGCCLTVVANDGRHLDFDASAETLRCTSGLSLHRFVNLERALRLADRLGGHLMSGHVDGVGNVTAFGAVTQDPRSNWHLEVDAPSSLALFIAPKGSIAVDGVSLTINTVERARFAVNLIPHTLAVTTLGQLQIGSRVNLEVDLIARYVQRMLANARDDADGSS